MTQEDDLFGNDETARSKALNDLITTEGGRLGGIKLLLTYILQHINELENP